jgi:2-dehydro-3-deoxygluconokinase
MEFVAFGESLFRSVTQRGERLADAQTLGFYLGGTELNIAANLSALGCPSRWVSALPSGISGELILDKIKNLGVDTGFCSTSESSRVGWYLMESGAAPRPDIVFHRNASAMAEEKSFSFNWTDILKGARVFHTSGVTCGLSQALTAEIKKLAQLCQEKKILLSYDLNFRKNIWSLEESVRRQKDIVPLADILFCSSVDLKLFYGEDFEKDHFSKVFSNSRARFLVMSQRSDDQREYGIDVISREKRFSSPRFQVSQIDRIGMGDAAAAGFFKIFLSHSQPDLMAAASWAGVAGALKSGVLGDTLLMKSNEIERVLSNPQSGIVR